MNDTLLLIATFLGFMALVAVITYFKTNESNLDTADGYFLAGRSLSGIVIAGSLLLTNLQASNFVGMSGQAYDFNMCVMGWEVGSGITLILVALFLVPRYLKQGITTIPEFIESRFDKGTKNFVSILFLLLYIVNMLPVTLYSGAVAIAGIFHVDKILGITYVQSIWLMVWIIGIIGSIYAIFGGLRAVAISDTINGIALVIGGLAVPFFGLIAIGKGSIGAGFTKFLSTSPEKFNAIGSASDPLPITACLTGLVLVNLYYWGTDQSIIQRALGGKSLAESQKGVMLAGFLKILTPLILIIPGIMAYQILNPADVTNSDLAYSLFVNAVLPTPVAGFVAAAMMGAILSTFNSVLNSSATLFAINVYKPKWGKNKTDAELVKVGKVFGGIIAVLAMFTAPLIMNTGTGLFDYLQTVNGFFNVPIFTIIFMGYMTKRVSPIAAKVGLVFFVGCYATTQLVWDTGLHYLHVSAILFVVTCLIMYVIGKIAPRKEPFELPNNHLVDETPWKNRFRMAGFITWLMLSFYVIFSKIGLAREGGTSSITWISILALAVVCGTVSLLLEKKFVKKDSAREQSQSKERLTA
ncbi:MAG: solute:sodium symporter family transporter [Clostridium sp.]|nr:solute:sodium symporter family transporter [Clostridium sp.]